MEKVDIFNYYAFGFDYCNLLRDRSDDTNSELFNRCSLYLGFITALKLQVTLSAINHQGLEETIDKLSKKAKSKATKDEIVDKPLHDELNEKLNKIEIVLDSELKIRTGYVLDEKRYSNEILIDKIQRLFNDSYFGKLPAIAQYDFGEAGKCLAFDRFTAVAFHALRGTEDVLKFYYSQVLKKVATDSNTWGTYETEINDAIKKKSLSPTPPEDLMINLGSLRKYYRNKTQHPQLTYSADEAQDLLSLCTKTVNELVSDLAKRKLI